MKEGRMPANRLSVEKLPRYRNSLNHQSSLPTILNTQMSSVIHVSVRPRQSVRSILNHKDNKESNNSLSHLTVHQNYNRSNKSVIGEDSNKQLTSTTHPVSVIRTLRPPFQFHQNPSKSINIPNEIGKNIDHQNNINNQSTSNIHIIDKDRSGTIEALRNPINDHHRSINNKKKQNFIEYCCRCSRRRALLSFITLLYLILLGIILAIILIILMRKTKKTTNIPSYLRWNTSGITLFGTAGIRGNTSYQFYNPCSLVFDSFGDLYISDTLNNRVQKCNIRNLTCTTVAGQANAVSGINMSYLNFQTFLYIDTNNNLYIADSGNQRIQLWNYGATYGKQIAGITGSSGSVLNQFSGPYGIDIDPNSNAIYISDFNNHRIMKYFPGNLTGMIIAGGHGSGINNTQLSYPNGLLFDSSTNSLIISNYGANDIIRWIIGDSKWTIIAGSSTGLSGTSSTLFNHPTSVTYDPMGNMYVAVMFNHRIQLYLVGQTNGTTIAGISGIPGNNSTMLYYPKSVAFDNQLNLYVADELNQRIQQFLRY
ncbi:unnamed protein product [Adineta steineri]|uniref:NHL repeat containing protein n=1 Tax=Adineta steineri TaxID=433720 RepID=A0A815YRD1_9BILA|nr:unnamed protein product [Adineta steineri]CAF1574349.1 unnamed protein product [Adineta steineri]